MRVQLLRLEELAARLEGLAALRISTVRCAHTVPDRDRWEDLQEPSYHHR